MDQNNTTPPTPETSAAMPSSQPDPAVPQTSPIQPTPTPPPAPVAEKKSPLLMIIVLAVIILLAAGASAYLLMRKPAAKQETTTSLPVKTQTVSPTMTPDEKEVNNIDTGASESSDVKDVQNDVNSLISPTTPAQ